MRAKSLDDSTSLKESGKALLEALRNAPPIEAPQRCKICGKDSIRVICDSEDCSLEFYSAGSSCRDCGSSLRVTDCGICPACDAENQEWPEDKESEIGDFGTDEGEEY